MAPCEPVDERVRASSDADGLSDQELIAAINRGDAGAFEILYFRHRDWVVGWAFRFTGDRDAALDVLQETFLYVLRKFPGFRLTANFKTFLYPAVRNLSIAVLRKAQRYQGSEEALNQLENTPARHTGRVKPDQGWGHIWFRVGVTSCHFDKRRQHNAVTKCSKAAAFPLPIGWGGGCFA